MSDLTGDTRTALDDLQSAVAQKTNAAAGEGQKDIHAAKDASESYLYQAKTMAENVVTSAQVRSLQLTLLPNGLDIERPFHRIIFTVAQIRKPHPVRKVLQPGQPPQRTPRQMTSYRLRLARPNNTLHPRKPLHNHILTAHGRPYNHTSKKHSRQQKVISGCTLVPRLLMRSLHRQVGALPLTHP